MKFTPTKLKISQKTPFLVEAEKVETFAEDYSEEINPENYEYHSKKRDNNVWTQKLKRRFKENSMGVKGCPNKYNVHHICTVYCLERWGEGLQRPPKAYRDRFNRLIERYPLPKNWVHVWDSGCESFYFWNQSTDEVSWLPPKHPKASIGPSAATLRGEREKPEEMQVDEEAIPLPSKSPPREEDKYQAPAPAAKKTKTRDLEKILRTKKGRRQFYENSDVIDPMDPASYGECGKGRWSAGLDNDENTGVDTTVGSGLYQQRPYPAPGEVMKANKNKKKGEKNAKKAKKNAANSSDDDNGSD